MTTKGALFTKSHYIFGQRTANHSSTRTGSLVWQGDGGGRFLHLFLTNYIKSGTNKKCLQRKKMTLKYDNMGIEVA